MNDIQELHGTPLNDTGNHQVGRPWAATQLKAGAAVTSRWLFEEMRGWHDRRMAAHELSRLLHQSVRGDRARYQ